MPATIGHQTSQNIIALDSRGQWSTLPVSLKNLYMVLHKTISLTAILDIPAENNAASE